MRKVFVVLLAVIAVAAHAQTGFIREFTGDVQLKHAGASNFSPAQAGSQVASDTTVSTGFRSTAIIEIGSNVLVVQPLTRLTLAEISSSAGTENLNVNLQAGRVRVEVNPPAGTRANTTVRGPTATASVRGTSFEMDTRNLSVTSGNVSWRDSSGFSASVTAGFSSSIGDTGAVVDPVEIAEAELTVPAPVGVGDAGESTEVVSTEVTSIDVGIR